MTIFFSKWTRIRFFVRLVKLCINIIFIHVTWFFVNKLYFLNIVFLVVTILPWNQYILRRLWVPVDVILTYSLLTLLSLLTLWNKKNTNIFYFRIKNSLGTYSFTNNSVNWLKYKTNVKLVEKNLVFRYCACVAKFRRDTGI